MKVRQSSTFPLERSLFISYLAEQVGRDRGTVLPEMRTGMCMGVCPRVLPRGGK